MPADAHAKEGSGVDIGMHKVFRYIFLYVSNGMAEWKECVEGHTLTSSLMSYMILQLHRITL